MTDLISSPAFEIPKPEDREYLASIPLPKVSVINREDYIAEKQIHANDLRPLAAKLALQSGDQKAAHAYSLCGLFKVVGTSEALLRHVRDENGIEDIIEVPRVESNFSYIWHCRRARCPVATCVPSSLSTTWRNVSKKWSSVERDVFQRVDVGNSLHFVTLCIPGLEHEPNLMVSRIMDAFKSFIRHQSFKEVAGYFWKFELSMPFNPHFHMVCEVRSKRVIERELRRLWKNLIGEATNRSTSYYAEEISKEECREKLGYCHKGDWKAMAPEFQSHFSPPRALKNMSAAQYEAMILGIPAKKKRHGWGGFWHGGSEANRLPAPKNRGTQQKKPTENKAPKKAKRGLRSALKDNIQPVSGASSAVRENTINRLFGDNGSIEPQTPIVLKTLEERMLESGYYACRDRRDENGYNWSPVRDSLEIRPRFTDKDQNPT